MDEKKIEIRCKIFRILATGFGLYQKVHHIQWCVSGTLWTGSGSWPQNKPDPAPDPTFTRIKLKEHRKILGKFFRSVYYLLKFHNLNNANTRIVPKYFSILR